MLVARSSLALAALTAALFACRTPATEVLLTIDTDIQRPLDVQVIVFEGTLPPSMAATRAHATDAQRAPLGAPIARFPYELGLIPKRDGARDGAITAVLSVHSPATPTQPAIDFDRPMQLQFVHSTRQNARVWLRFACSTAVDGCVSRDVPCTFAQRCFEMGRVCDDNAECGSPIVEQVTHGTDATTDAPRDARADSAADAEAAIPLVDIAPRLIAPLSTARTSSRRPTLRWSLPTGVTEARVELCADHACARILSTMDGVQSARAAMDLDPGWVFWRVRARSGARVGLQTSPVWQFWVPARSASEDRDVSHGTIGDFNGDGLAELVVGSGATGGTTTGAVYIYRGNTAGVAGAPSQTLTYMTANGFGKAATSAGDVNGDGFADLIVGAWNLSAPTKARCGAIFIFHGGPSGLAPTAATVIEGTAAEDRFGMNVAGLGDVNGDGYSDVIAGASGQNIPNSPGNPGVARLFYGSASGVDESSEIFWRMGQMTDWFGHDVVALGDTNADGFADFGVSAPWADSNGLQNNGRALIVLGAAAFPVIGPGRQATNGTWFDGARTNEHFGGVRSAGDLDGDGYCDAAFVGDSAAGDSRGRVSIHSGGPMGVSAAAQRELTGTAMLDQLGFSGSMTGDVNDDGFDDLLLGAVSSTQSGVANSGFAALYLGSTNGVAPTAASRWTALPPAGGYFGFSTSILGDVNGDRIADFAISEPYVTVSGRMQNGRVTIGYGARAGSMLRYVAAGVEGSLPQHMFGFMLGR